MSEIGTDTPVYAEINGVHTGCNGNVGEGSNDVLDHSIISVKSNEFVDEPATAPHLCEFVISADEVDIVWKENLQQKYENNGFNGKFTSVNEISEENKWDFVGEE